MSKASKAALSELHGVLAREMKKVLTEGQIATDAEGNAVRVTPGASYFNAIRQFLKDNSIEAVRDQNDDLNDLASAARVHLPFTETDEFGPTH